MTTDGLVLSKVEVMAPGMRTTKTVTNIQRGQPGIDAAYTIPCNARSVSGGPDIKRVQEMIKRSEVLSD